MKKGFLLNLLIMCFLVMPLAAGAYIINDTGDTAYWGGTAVNASATAYGDVIGSPYFNVNQMEVSRIGDNWTVTLTGEYFAYHAGSSGLAPNLAPGDLYIASNGWNLSGQSGNFENDKFNINEGWNYVVTCANDSWGLYGLNDTYTVTNIGSYPTNYIYRTDQAWQGGATGGSIGSATRELTDTYLRFTFNTENITLGNSIGLHWAVQCGNDVVEGEVPVPEPATMLLLGFGLLGLGLARRKS